MIRIWICALMVLAVCSPGSAQAPPSEKAPKPSKDSVKIETLTVHAASAAVPALQYQLLPDLLDQESGDAMQLYYLAMAVLDSQAAPEPDKLDASVNALLDAALAEMPRDKAREIVDQYRQVLSEVALAARSESCVWNLPYRTEGINLPLPMLAKFRRLARLVALQARLQIAEHRFPAAVTTLQSGFSMARHVTEGPTLINALVGTAIADLMLARVRELMQEPGSPNLYWALADLPRPMIDARRAIQLERAVLQFTVPSLRNLSDRTMTSQEGQKIIEDISGVLGMMGDSSNRSDAEARFAMTAMGVRMYPAAKKYLASRGYAAERIQAMPVQQAILLYAVDQYGVWRDEVFKWLALPYWQAADRVRQAEATIARDLKNSENINPLMSIFLPTFSNAYFKINRVDRLIAAMQCVEAIRMHAAAHAGGVPATLDEITITPIPLDPITGKNFNYKVDGERIVLEGPPPTPESPRDGLRYEITLVK